MFERMKDIMNANPKTVRIAKYTLKSASLVAFAGLIGDVSYNIVSNALYNTPLISHIRTGNPAIDFVTYSLVSYGGFKVILKAATYEPKKYRTENI